MTISRRLAHQVTNKLQIIGGLIETGRAKPAVSAIRDLADLINRSIESRDEEKERELREQS